MHWSININFGKTKKEQVSSVLSIYDSSMSITNLICGRLVLLVSVTEGNCKKKKKKKKVIKGDVKKEKRETREENK